jgi:chromate transporter
LQQVLIDMTPNADTPQRPHTKTELFWAFTWLALQGFGGVLAVVQRELVDKRRWLSREQFLEDWAVAQIMPGPNVVNLSLMIGGRYFGWKGAITALAGMLAFPLCTALLLAIWFASVANLESAQGALRGMGAVAAGLIAATGLKLVSALKTNTMGKWACGVLAGMTFVAVGWLHWPLAFVLLGLGAPATAWAYHCLQEAPSKTHAGLEGDGS